MGVQGLTRNQIQELSQLLTQQKIDWNAVDKYIGTGSLGSRIVSALTGRTHLDRVKKIIDVTNKSFDRLRSHAIKFHHNHEKAIAYRQRFVSYQTLGEWVKNEINRLKKADSSEFKKEYQALECQLVALKYSIEASNGGVDKLKNHDLVAYDKLKQMALDWKQKEPLAIQKELNDLEIAQLKEAAKYPEWLPLLVKDCKYRHEFFNWAVRDYCPVDVFIETPKIRETLKTALLPGIIGRLRKPVDCDNDGCQDPLRFERRITDDGTRKVLTMPFGLEKGKVDRLNVLNPNKIVHFQEGQWKLSLDTFWKEHAAKNEKESRIHLGPDGFINFEPMQGVWNATQQKFEWPTVTVDNWAEVVPATDIVTENFLAQKFGVDHIKGRKLFFKVISTRQSTDLNILKAHGFLQVYVNLGNDKWKVMDFGAYADRFPMGAWENLVAFCNTVPRVVACMDQNGSYSQRQTASKVFFPDENESKHFSEMVYQFMIEKGVFQFSAKNCSYPIATLTQKVSKNAPNFFRLPMTKAKTGLGLLDRIFKFLDKCRPSVRNIGLRIIQFLFGSMRGMKVKQNGVEVWDSVSVYYKNNPQEIHHPAYLHYQIENANGQGPFSRGCEITWGNTMTKYPTPVVV